jgi:nuclear pore complex protein Nup107
VADTFTPVQKRKGYLNYSQTLTKIPFLDPDALSHQPASALHPEDARYEDAVRKSLWDWLRRGQISDATQFVQSIGKDYYGALFQASQMYRVEAAADNNADHLVVKGCRNRLGFKKLVHSMTSTIVGNPYERAVYGVLAGNLDLIRPVCTSFEDFLFAHALATLEDNVKPQHTNICYNLSTQS